jgi:DNA-binding transcriptional LysR family regulator
MEDWDWRILQVLYEQKNITRTAQLLFMSQPALTARLQQIEKEFGIKVVHRTSKGVQFTPQGEFLARSSSEVLQKLRGIREQVANLDSEISGTLRLGASSYFTMYTMPVLLKQFGCVYPDVEFKVTTAWSKDIFNLVHNQDVHIGFISSDYGWQNQKHLLFEEEIFIASVDEVRLEDLPRLSRIDYLTDALIRASIDRWWRENFAQAPIISMEVDKLATCKEMVKHGLGYGIMPARLLRDCPHMHRIRLEDREGNPVLRRSWMIYHEESLSMNAVRAFVDFVKQMDFSQ